jgi:hypothetical protein
MAAETSSKHTTPDLAQVFNFDDPNLDKEDLRSILKHVAEQWKDFKTMLRVKTIDFENLQQQNKETLLKDEKLTAELQNFQKLKEENNCLKLRLEQALKNEETIKIKNMDLQSIVLRYSKPSADLSAFLRKQRNPLDRTGLGLETNDVFENISKQQNKGKEKMFAENSAYQEPLAERNISKDCKCPCFCGSKNKREKQKFHKPNGMKKPPNRRFFAKRKHPADRKISKECICPCYCSKSSYNNNKTKRCYNCNKIGHVAATCFGNQNYTSKSHQQGSYKTHLADDGRTRNRRQVWVPKGTNPAGPKLVWVPKVNST